MPNVGAAVPFAAPGIALATGYPAAPDTLLPQALHALIESTTSATAGLADTVKSCSHRILVVDDDPSIRELQADILRSVGFHVDLAEDGERAWRDLCTGTYDLLVTDYLMPRVSGLALVRQLRVANMVLPVVMVSGTIGELDTVRLTLDPWSRIHAFVRKPFTVSELLAAVHSALQLPMPA